MNTMVFWMLVLIILLIVPGLLAVSLAMGNKPLSGAKEAAMLKKIKPEEPETKVVLSKEEVSRLLLEISKKIEGLKANYPHLAEFDKTCVKKTFISYEHGLIRTQGPHFVDDVPQINGKLRLKAEEFILYNEKNGLYLYIMFEQYENYKHGARIWQPDLWIGNWAVEMQIEGAATQALGELREKIKQIILAAKQEVDRR